MTAVGAKGVWITRAEPGAAATAARVARLGLEPIVAPLLSFRPLLADIELRPGEALAFTSLNGAARTAALTDRRDAPVFAVGDATAEAARAAGFRDVRSAGGDVDALAALIVRAGPEGGVLHPAARETAGDLVGRLRAAGVAARKVPVYETEAAAALPEAISAALAEGRLKAILMHSPKAARTAAAMAGGAGWETLGIVGLSEACVAPFRALSVRRVVAAPSPTEDALIAALAQL